MTISANRQTNRLLGYPDDARLLLINADDFGMCHAVNEAIFSTIRQGLVRSTTLMAACPWALHAMHLLAEHPEIAFGVHLTAICDSEQYKWRPLTSGEKVSSLIDEAGYFYTFARMPEFMARVRLDELELEFRAQIEAVLAAGLKPTHLDWHALRIDGRADIADVMLRLAREYGLALRVRGQPAIERVRSLGLPCNDYDFLDSYLLDPANKSARYAQLLRELPPGLSEWAVHPGLANVELQTIEPGGAAFRQADFDFLMSPAAQELVAAEGIILIDYRPLQAIWRSA
ncbi:MAG TPA: polysaccharide deacetylase family protein [Herpetosiphonaceae bacterium]